MKITSVRANWLRVPIPEDKVSVSDFGRNESFNTTLVRVETDEGLVGHGEAKATVGSLGSQRALAAAIEQELGPLITGEDPRDIARLWEVMYNGSRSMYKLIGRWLITLKHLSLINILAGEELVPEFMPYYDSTVPIAQCAVDLLSSPDRLVRIRSGLPWRSWLWSALLILVTGITRVSGLMSVLLRRWSGLRIWSRIFLWSRLLWIGRGVRIVIIVGALRVRLVRVAWMRCRRIGIPSLMTRLRVGICRMRSASRSMGRMPRYPPPTCGRPSRLASRG